MAGRIIIEDKDNDDDDAKIQDDESGVTTQENEAEKVKTPKKPEEATRSRREGKNEEDEYTDCDLCDSRVRTSRLSDHKFKAHKIDRRVEKRDDDNTDLEAPPEKGEKKKKEPSSDSGKKKSGKTSGAWFGSRAND